MAVDQWYREIHDKSDADEIKVRAGQKKPRKIPIFRFKSQTPDEPYTPDFNGIVITTLTMFTSENRR